MSGRNNYRYSLCDFCSYGIMSGSCKDHWQEMLKFIIFSFNPKHLKDIWSVCVFIGNQTRDFCANMMLYHLSYRNTQKTTMKPIRFEIKHNIKISNRNVKSKLLLLLWPFFSWCHKGILSFNQSSPSFVSGRVWSSISERSNSIFLPSSQFKMRKINSLPTYFSSKSHLIKLPKFSGLQMEFYVDISILCWKSIMKQWTQHVPHMHYKWISFYEEHLK